MTIGRLHKEMDLNRQFRPLARAENPGHKHRFVFKTSHLFWNAYRSPRAREARVRNPKQRMHHSKLNIS